MEPEDLMIFLFGVVLLGLVLFPSRLKALFAFKPSPQLVIAAAQKGVDAYSGKTYADMGQEMLDAGANLTFADPTFQFNSIPVPELPLVGTNAPAEDQ